VAPNVDPAEPTVEARGDAAAVAAPLAKGEPAAEKPRAFAPRGEATGAGGRMGSAVWSRMGGRSGLMRNSWGCLRHARSAWMWYTQTFSLDTASIVLEFQFISILVLVLSLFCAMYMGNEEKIFCCLQAGEYG
jgi:hypothetical protein